MTAICSAASVSDATGRIVRRTTNQLPEIARPRPSRASSRNASAKLVQLVVDLGQRQRDLHRGTRVVDVAGNEVVSIRTWTVPVVTLDGRVAEPRAAVGGDLLRQRRDDRQRHIARERSGRPRRPSGCSRRARRSWVEIDDVVQTVRRDGGPGPGPRWPGDAAGCRGCPAARAGPRCRRPQRQPRSRTSPRTPPPP